MFVCVCVCCILIGCVPMNKTRTMRFTGPYRSHPIRIVGIGTCVEKNLDGGEIVTIYFCSFEIEREKYNNNNI